MYVYCLKKLNITSHVKKGSKFLLNINKLVLMVSSDAIGDGKAHQFVMTLFTLAFQQTTSRD